MTDNEARIEQLVQVPPRVERTKWQAALRVASFISALAALAAITLSVILAFNESSLATCTNANLAARQATRQRDLIADIQYGKAQAAQARAAAVQASAQNRFLIVASGHDRKATQAAFDVLKAAQATYAAAQSTYQVASTTYLQIKKADLAAGAAHPLGQC